MRPGCRRLTFPLCRFCLSIRMTFLFRINFLLLWSSLHSAILFFKVNQHAILFINYCFLGLNSQREPEQPPGPPCLYLCSEEVGGGSLKSTLCETVREESGPDTERPPSASADSRGRRDRSRSSDTLVLLLGREAW